jgi:hypothetical protein
MSMHLKLAFLFGDPPPRGWQGWEKPPTGPAWSDDALSSLEKKLRNAEKLYFLLPHNL